MKQTVDLPQQVWDDLQQTALEHGVTIDGLISGFAQRGLLEAAARRMDARASAVTLGPLVVALQSGMTAAGEAPQRADVEPHDMTRATEPDDTVADVNAASSQAIHPTPPGKETIVLDLDGHTVAGLEQAAAEEGTTIAGAITRLVTVDRLRAAVDGRAATRGASVARMRNRLRGRR